jgi:hypothetical protein
MGKAPSKLNASRRRKGIRLSPRPPFIQYGVNLVPSHHPGVPRDVTVIVAEDAQGRAQWVLWHWACHATAAPEAKAISADFPGEIRASLRRHFDDAALPVLFLPGFNGDIRPDAALWPVNLKQLAMYPLQRPFANPTNANFRAFCEVLSRDAEAALAKAAPIEPADKARIARSEVALTDIIDGENSGAIELIRIDAGGLSLLLISAEVCSPYLERLKAHVPRGALMCGYANDVRLYLPVDEQIAEGGYEVEGFFNSFHLNGAFKPGIEAAFIDAARGLAAKA